MDIDSIIKFLFYKITTRSPESDEDWEIARKEYAKSDKDNQLDLSLDMIKGIDKALGSKTLIRNETFSLVGWAYNLKELFRKNKREEKEDRSFRYIDWIDENSDEDEIRSYEELDRIKDLESKKRAMWGNIDKNEAMDVVKETGLDLEFLSLEYRKDKDIVLVAVKENGHALAFADNSLTSNEEIILSAVMSKGEALYHASDNLKNDKKIVLEAVKTNAGAIEYASDSLKRDRELALIAALKLAESEEACYAFNELLDEKFKCDKGFVIEVVLLDGGALCCVDEAFKKDKGVVFAAIQDRGDAFMHAHESLKADRDFALKVVSEDGMALQFVSPELKKDKVLVLAAIKKYGHFIGYADESIRNDEDIIHAIEVSNKARQA